MTRVLGAEHPYTLTARGSLARWTGQVGNPAGARDQFAELLPMRERVLGAEHPYALTARRSLARWTGEAGDPAGARDRYAALLPVIERVLGTEHPDSQTTHAELAYWIMQLKGRYHRRSLVKAFSDSGLLAWCSAAQVTTPTVGFAAVLETARQWCSRGGDSGRMHDRRRGSALSGAASRPASAGAGL
jgi:hypothetical protein